MYLQTVIDIAAVKHRKPIKWFISHTSQESDNIISPD